MFDAMVVFRNYSDDIGIGHDIGETFISNKSKTILAIAGDSDYNICLMHMMMI